MKFLGSAFVLNAVMGLGAITGVSLGAVGIAVVAKKITGKTLIAHVVGSLSESESK